MEKKVASKELQLVPENLPLVVVLKTARGVVKEYVLRSSSNGEKLSLIKKEY